MSQVIDIKLKARAGNTISYKQKIARWAVNFCKVCQTMSIHHKTEPCTSSLVDVVHSVELAFL